MLWPESPHTLPSVRIAAKKPQSRNFLLESAFQKFNEYLSKTNNTVISMANVLMGKLGRHWILAGTHILKGNWNHEIVSAAKALKTVCIWFAVEKF